MSLVHEALRKAEREKQRKLGIAPVVSAPTPVPSHAPAHAPGVATPLPARAFAPVTPSEPAPQKSHYTLFLAVISIVAFVAIVAIVFLVSRITPGSSETAKTTPTPVVAKEEPKPVESHAWPPEVPKPAVESPVPAVEPVAPAAVDVSNFTLSGIMTDPEGKLCAVLNGRVVYVDGYVEGAVVKSIDRDRVTLDIKGRDVVLRLF